MKLMIYSVTQDRLVTVHLPNVTRTSGDDVDDIKAFHTALFCGLFDADDGRAWWNDECPCGKQYVDKRCFDPACSEAAAVHRAFDAADRAKAAEILRGDQVLDGIGSFFI